MLGQPLSMLAPEVIGFNWKANRARASPPPTWCLPSRRCCAKKAWSANSWSFYGPGLDHLSLADRPPSPIWRPNMARHAASSRLTPRHSIISTPPGAGARVALIEKYAKASGHVAHGEGARARIHRYDRPRSFQRRSVARRPKRPEGRVALEDMGATFETSLANEYKKPGGLGARFPVEGENYDLGHGDVVIAAITSCTNTSTPAC